MSISWPGGRKAAASLTFDFDAESVWLAMDPANAGRPGALSIGVYGARVGVPLILDTLARHDVRATFFVVGKNVELYPDRVAAILDGGHEIAVHGYTHTPPSLLTPDEEEAELVKAKALLEGAGATITGYRSPSWEVSPVTLDLLQKHGFRYSSQYMADIRPYRHDHHDLIELPIQWLLDDWPHFQMGPGQMNRPVQTTRHVEQLWMEELEGISALGGHTIITMHPQVMGRPSRVALLDRLIGAMKARDDLWIATCGEVAALAETALPKGSSR
ncbi:polysaccharide deacetylase [Mesorhizobium sp. BR1-1-16]|uniref:polysaccharide deacetylase family protein n=1 Tax=Mesorhizobium sp. BR1-1-16 TaxID=2876653 RepID=UPI001CCCD8EA|nr:polysaccharide deacetylase [Mesorhizobium sp. BR1-1-16]MBZ9935613.1 polysaccharide deacetylase [Mesorhizobium sp. BR1-1-16]